MPTNTYVALDKVTVGTATPSITFSSVPSTYTDLVLVFNGSTTAGNTQNIYCTVNGDSSALYSWTRIVGDGTSASSARATGGTYFIVSDTGTVQMSAITQFMNYANTSTFKTALSRSSASDFRTTTYVDLYRSTNAISSITFTMSSGNFAVGSTFSLYGIAATSAGAKATGGVVYSDSQYWYHAFTTTGAFVPSQSLSCEVLVVAGGGGGGGNIAGGGGGGGFRISSLLLASGTSYTATIGGGGTAGTGNNNDATNGIDSTISTITATGGGRGAGNAVPGATASTGGSGGGGSWNNPSGAAGNTPSTSPSQGNSGGAAFTSSFASGGGGGGAGANGTAGSGTANAGGDGGIGSDLASTWASATFTGISGYYAGGGGGGRSREGTTTGASGGTGGGGVGGFDAGSPNTGIVGGTGTINTGGGGGGAAWGSAQNGGNGGSGIVIVRYAK